VDEAIVTHEQNLTIQSRLFGNEHPDTLTYRYNLAAAYQAARRVSDAIILYEQDLP
jgi:hypothetical protein